MEVEFSSNLGTVYQMLALEEEYEQIRHMQCIHMDLNIDRFFRLSFGNSDHLMRFIIRTVVLQVQV